MYAADGSKLHFDCSEIKALDMIMEVNSKSKAMSTWCLWYNMMYPNLSISAWQNGAIQMYDIVFVCIVVHCYVSC